MALWDLREARIVSTFSAVPLRQISWSPEGEQIWAIDRLGRSWRWEVAELLAGG